MAKKLTSKYLVHTFDGTMTDTSREDPKLPIARWLANSCGEAIWAASNGNIRTLESLVSQQRDLQQGDYDIRTPLHLASAEGQLEVVKFLLNQPTVRDNIHKVPVNEPLMESLIEHGMKSPILTMPSYYPIAGSQRLRAMLEICHKHPDGWMFKTMEVDVFKFQKDRSDQIFTRKRLTGFTIPHSCRDIGIPQFHHKHASFRNFGI